jgi:hypothetical protein
MAERAQQQREQQREQPEAFDANEWRKSNVVFGIGGEILYPTDKPPCPTCGGELPGDDWPKFDHPFEQDPDDDGVEEVCTCGYHESYHRAHDCVKDAHEPLPCACAGGQPWSCCMNRYSRQQQFLLQRLANVLRAAAEPASSGSPSTPDQRRIPRP